MFLQGLSSTGDDETDRAQKFTVINQKGQADGVFQNLTANKQSPDTLTLLKVFALGSEEVAQGKVKPISEVVQRLRTKYSKP